MALSAAQAVVASLTSPAATETSASSTRRSFSAGTRQLDDSTLTAEAEAVSTALAKCTSALQPGSLSKSSGEVGKANSAARDKGEGSGGHHVLVVGAGLSGAVVARAAAEKGHKVLVIDKRPHLGGNCYDYINAAGFRVAEYGPHFFHTSSERVWQYVQQFSDWTPWEHRVMARITQPGGVLSPDDLHVPVPVNINSVNSLFGLSISSEEEMQGWLAKEQVPCATPLNSEQVALSRVGQRLYELIFKGYTKKQWDKYPAELEPSVLARIPVRSNWEDRYFTDSYQALPLHGYSSFIGGILSHPNIELRLDCDFFAERHCLQASSRYQQCFFTGPVDAYYSHLGLDRLEYRSCSFKEKTLPTATAEARLQPVSQVNYPSREVPFTRKVEYKHLPNQPWVEGDKEEERGEGERRGGSSGSVGGLGSKIMKPGRLLNLPCSSIVTEYSSSEGEPFYPVPAQRNQQLYRKYQEAAAAEGALGGAGAGAGGAAAAAGAAAVGELGYRPAPLTFVGRLATYRYYNMDQAILAALECSDGVFGRGVL